jgi:hypothetical protein
MLATDHQVDAFRLAGVEQELGLLRQERLAVLLVAALRSAHAADHLLGRDPVQPLGIGRARSPGRRRSQCRS